MNKSYSLRSTQREIRMEILKKKAETNILMTSCLKYQTELHENRHIFKSNAIKNSLF